MPDIFFQTAQGELSEDIKCLEGIISHCKSDSDVISSYKEIERHLHKIKGLSPMIGFDKMRDIANLVDKILIDIIENDLKFASYDFVNEAIKTMKMILNEQDLTAEQMRIKNKISFPQILKLFG